MIQFRKSTKGRGLALNLQDFHLHREDLKREKIKYRELCTTCLQPEFGCYCQHIFRFDPIVKFIILIHPIERRRRIATGRMSFLCLENSELIAGMQFGANERVSEIIRDPRYDCVLLYPGHNSMNLSKVESKPNLFSKTKIPVVFVVDGTWTTARKMVNQSKNLLSIPKICFTPPGQSQFKVRKQPTPECYSTIEAVHYSLELLGPQVGFDTNSRVHDKLLFVFNKMVERQVEFALKALHDPLSTSYRRPRIKVVA